MQSTRDITNFPNGSAASDRALLRSGSYDGSCTAQLREEPRWRGRKQKHQYDAEKMCAHRRLSAAPQAPEVNRLAQNCAQTGISPPRKCTVAQVDADEADLDLRIVLPKALAIAVRLPAT